MAFSRRFSVVVGGVLFVDRDVADIADVSVASKVSADGGVAIGTDVCVCDDRDDPVPDRAVSIVIGNLAGKLARTRVSRAKVRSRLTLSARKELLSLLLLSLLLLLWLLSIAGDKSRL